MTRRRLKIIITKIRRQTTGATALRTFCAVCACEVEIFNPADAAKILEVEEQTLDQFVFVGKIHAVQTMNGNLWICKNSLFQNENGE
jgi:predicted site-specific integrase-resolvase